jgi:hypothetical protein
MISNPYKFGFVFIFQADFFFVFYKTLIKTSSLGFSLSPFFVVGKIHYVRLKFMDCACLLLFNYYFFFWYIFCSINLLCLFLI